MPRVSLRTSQPPPPPSILSPSLSSLCSLSRERPAAASSRRAPALVRAARAQAKPRPAQWSRRPTPLCPGSVRAPDAHAAAPRDACAPRRAVVAELYTASLSAASPSPVSCVMRNYFFRFFLLPLFLSLKPTPLSCVMELNADRSLPGRPSLSSPFSIN
jgi:hypothetical protein